MRFVLTAVCALGLSMAAWAQHHEHPRGAHQVPADEPKPILCPVTGKPIDRDCVGRFRGRWVYFATSEAREKFELDPYAFAEGLQAQWALDRPLRVQVLCPVTDEPCSNAVYTGKGLDAVYFATEEAKARWEKDAEPYRKKLEKCYTFQTGCATCGQPINPVAARVFDGRKLYFCCTGCPAGFEADKAANLKRVDQQIAANEAAFKKRVRQEEGATTRPAAGGNGGKSDAG